MKKLNSVLTEKEAEFVKLVYRNPGCKLNGPNESSYYEDDGSKYGEFITLWNNPEKLGLIKTVGSYKWVPTDKLDLCLV